jgi:hypothetical protein
VAFKAEELTTRVFPAGLACPEDTVGKCLHRSKKPCSENTRRLCPEDSRRPCQGNSRPPCPEDTVRRDSLGPDGASLALLQRQLRERLEAQV